MTQSKDTVCKDCCFATWDGITQTGCDLGILDQYRELGVDVLECYDEDAEFNVVYGRTCPYKRSKQWKEHYGDEYLNRLDLETKLPYHVVIFATNDMRDLDKTIKSIEAQQLKPALVTVVREKGNTIRPQVIVNRLKETELIHRTVNHLIRMSRDKALNLLFKSNKLPYYAVFNSGYEIPSDFLQTINDYVIKRLGQFAAIVPDEDGNGLVIPSSVHEYWYVQGNPDKTMIENIQEWECENSKEKKICFTMKELRQIVTSPA